MLLSLLLTSSAFAGPFDRKTTMEDWPDQQVDEGLVLPRGWLAVGVSADTLKSTAVRGGQGQRLPLADDNFWRLTQTWLSVEQGFSSQVTLYLALPYVMARAGHWSDTGDAPAFDGVVTRAPGDILTGARWAPLQSERLDAGVDIQLKLPSGVEWPSNLDGDTQSFLTGSGVTNLGLTMMAAARPHERLRLGLDAGYVIKFPSVVGYVIQTDGYGNGWMDPGDEVRAELDATVQIIDPLALSLGANLSYRGAYRVGTGGESVWSLDMQPIDGGAGLYSWVNGGVDWWFSEHWGAAYDLSWQLSGADTRQLGALGLNEFAPQPGLTQALSAEVRW